MARLVCDVVGAADVGDKVGESFAPYEEGAILGEAVGLFDMLGDTVVGCWLSDGEEVGTLESLFVEGVRVGTIVLSSVVGEVVDCTSVGVSVGLACVGNDVGIFVEPLIVGK